MDAPEVPTATTLPDLSAPQLTLRSPCGSTATDSCTEDASGRKFCGNVGSTFFDVSFRTNEGGAVYYSMTRLPAHTSLVERYKCERLQMSPGEVYEVPPGERWRGCEPEPGSRRRLSALPLSLRGNPGPAAAAFPAVLRSIPGPAVSEGGRAVSPVLGRGLQQVSPGFGCAVTAPCACCEPQLSCKLGFEDAWATRAYLADAGELLQSGCGYMSVSTCTSLPLAEQFELYSNGTGAAPNVTALPAYAAALAAANTSAMSTNASASLNSSLVSAADSGAATNSTGGRRRLLQGVSDEIVIGPGGGSGEAFTQPQYVAPGFSASGLEPDSYYALFAVSEDRTRPTPNRPVVARQWIIRSQAVGPPACEVSCSLAESTVDSLQLNVKLNTSGRVYYVLQANGSALEPSPSHVRTALDCDPKCLMFGAAMSATPSFGHLDVGAR